MLNDILGMNSERRLTVLNVNYRRDVHGLQR